MRCGVSRRAGWGSSPRGASPSCGGAGRGGECGVGAWGRWIQGAGRLERGEAGSSCGPHMPGVRRLQVGRCGRVGWRLSPSSPNSPRRSSCDESRGDFPLQTWCYVCSESLAHLVRMYHKLRYRKAPLEPTLHPVLQTGCELVSNAVEVPDELVLVVYCRAWVFLRGKILCSTYLSQTIWHACSPSALVNRISRLCGRGVK